MKVLLLGAGGHAAVVVEALRAQGVEPFGLLDAREDLHGTSVLGVAILGGDANLANLKSEGVTHFVVTVGSVRASTVRQHLFEQAIATGFIPCTVTHPTALLSPSAVIEQGATVLARSVVNAGARVGANAIINTAAIVEHGCVVGAHAHVATGAILASGVHIGEGAHIGAGAVVRQLTHVGAGATVGAGAVVIETVGDGNLVIGVPARVRT
jgi:sugar O-acyltransferase (sialic acid O-acetyltransferase NeuD family)